MKERCQGNILVPLEGFADPNKNVVLQLNESKQQQQKLLARAAQWKNLVIKKLENPFYFGAIVLHRCTADGTLLQDTVSVSHLDIV